jgi:hypothetical protein
LCLVPELMIPTTGRNFPFYGMLPQSDLISASC